MNQFFGTQFTQEDLQQRLAQRRRNGSQLQRTSSMPMQAPMSQGTGNVQMTGMMGNSLDDIIMQNSTELRQRQDFSPAYPGQGLDRRASMVQFGSSNNDLQGFQFAPKSTAEDSDIRRQSTGELDLGSFSDMGTMNLQSPSMTFQSPMHAHDGLVMDSNTFMSPEMAQNMMGGFSSLDTGDFSENGMNLFSNDFDQPFNNHMGTISGNLQDNFMMPGSMQQDVLSSHRNSIQDDMPSMAGLGVSDSKLSNSPTKMTTKLNQPMPELQPPIIHNSRPNTVTRESSYSQPETTPRAASPAKELDLPTELSLEPSPYSNIYSQSGFDMLGALIKVASRKNPQINIGKVDLSCAFVVCDIHQPDCPIIYVSDVFERLTGYTKYEVLGRNCRFLQSPDGKVQAGTKRNFIDNEPVYYIKKRVAERREVQRSLINYRKGGQPFVNLLTMIPITGEDDKEIRYYVGFQVDLVEKPTSVESKDANGMYTVDYSQGALPKYTWQPPENLRSPAEGGQTISRDDVSTVLNAINNGTESELTKRMWDKVLLENTDDVVHVLSLKGLFLYLSPSCRRVLEYDVSELVGTALSSVCHPSDIVPVTRELKDTSNGASVSVVFRIRRKRSGYTWFESHGSLCVEQGKGRKCIILVGRERPVYALGRQDIAAGGGICENEMWTKLSTSGMFLFVSTHVRTLLDRTPDELVGTSIQTLMRAESKVEFGRALEKARTGKCVTYKHDILNKRGLLLQAQTSLYPGDASEGSKPTFLVAQTRLLKAASRAGPSSKTSSTLGKENSSEKSPAFGRTAAISSQVSQEGERTPRSGSSVTGPITHAGGAGLPIGSQDVALASEQNIFEELKTTRSTSWQFELRQMEKSNRLLAEELASLLSAKKKRKRRKGAGHLQRDCANCHTRVTPEWRRGPSGQRDLCNSCGLRWAKQTGRVSPRTSSTPGDAASKHSNTSTSPIHSSPLQKEVLQNSASNPNLNPAPKAGAGNMKGESAAVPASLGGRTTLESQPVHKPSQGYREGGERGITRIGEEAEGFADAD